MTNENVNVALNYDAQARYFLEVALLASEHAKKNKMINPVAYNNFETVITGTHHAFAAELLLKGIIYYHIGSHPRYHEIKDLLNHESCKDLKESMENSFKPSNHIAYLKSDLDNQLDEYLYHLDEKDKYDKKEIENIARIREKLEFGSFDYFLELHSNHFVKMRYACEKTPPPLDMNFTSFLNNELRNELENRLLKLG
jgi:HEPN domain-containing protein